jgi:regulator of cell morphogenesis and NO signaling
MNELNLQSAVGQWVAHYPQLSRLFESLKIDYCCGGGVALEDACRGRNLDPQQVLAQIREAAKARTAEAADAWIEAPLAALCDHIEQTHHAYLKRELPRLAEIVAKVAAVHGEAHPALLQVQQTFEELRAELEPHMFKEERILFPAIRQLETAAAPPVFPFGTVANPIRVMESEHDHAGGALDRMRVLTDEYLTPSDACNTYRAMLDGLRELEQDMHTHVHKENNILFPRAAEVESSKALV